MLLFQEYLPESLLEKAAGKGKIVRVVGIAVAGFHCGLKFLRKISLCGDSNNPVLLYLHKLLRTHLNCGVLIRGEFLAKLPWHYMVILSGCHVIVNYGSYGTVPVRVLEHQQNLQKELELCPDLFNRITLQMKYEESRHIVAREIGCDTQNLVFVENVTEGMNCTLRSLLPHFEDNDAIFSLNVNYASVLKTVAVYSKKNNVEVIKLDVEFPIVSEEEFVNAFRNMFATHRNIRLAIFDHITSASAVKLPIKKIASLCREFGIISVVDAAHAPGQLFLDIKSYDIDIYIGNLHKWYYTPKSCAIMCIDERLHDKMQPTVVSHGCYGDLHKRFRGQGTKNYSAHLTAGYAVEYMKKLGGIGHLHSYITPLVEWAVQLYVREWNTEELSVPESMKAPYMRIVFLPEVFTKHYGSKTEDADRMIIDMLNDFKLAIFVNPVQGKLATRVSAQIFSTRNQYKYAARVIKRRANELRSKYN